MTISGWKRECWEGKNLLPTSSGISTRIPGGGDPDRAKEPSLKTRKEIHRTARKEGESRGLDVEKKRRKKEKKADRQGGPHRKTMIRARRKERKEESRKKRERKGTAAGTSPK